jgi:dihydrofolate reductase
MRKIVVGASVSLDGVLQAGGAPEEDPTGGFRLGGWIVPLWDEETGAAEKETFAAPYDLLLGRRTYDIFAAYWPNVHDGTTGALDAVVARRFNAATNTSPRTAPNR